MDTGSTGSTGKSIIILKSIGKVFLFIIGTVLALIFIALAGIKIYSLLLPEEETLTLNDEVRKDLPGDFIKLSRGYTYYELSGPENGQVVVLVHGFFVPLMGWDLNVDAITESGFRVLRYDFYGRGFSDRPEITYSLDLYVQQLYEIIEKLKVTTPVDLVGISYGGAIVMAFTHQYPNLVRRVTLNNPGGVNTSRELLQNAKVLVNLISFLGIPKIILSESFLMNFSEKIPGAFHIDDQVVQEYFIRVIEQIKYKGFRQAFVSAMLNGIEPLKDVYKEVGQQEGRKIMLVWGKQDSIMPASTLDSIIEAIPNIRVIVLEDAGHQPHMSSPEKFNRHLIEFLKKPELP
jgi:pimeloyl-ACP methyl ester carboxylesterase